MLFPYFFPSWTNFWNMYHRAHIVNLLTVYLLASSSHRCLIALCAWISCPPSMITSAFLRSLFFLLRLFADMFLHQMIIKDLLMSSIFTETSSFVNNSVLLMYFNNSLVTGNLDFIFYFQNKMPLEVCRHCKSIIWLWTLLIRLQRSPWILLTCRWFAFQILMHIVFFLHFLILINSQDMS